MDLTAKTSHQDRQLTHEDREIVGLQILSGLRIVFSSGRRHLWTASYDDERVEEY